MSIRSVAAAVALTVAASTAGAQNLVTNGSFETPIAAGNFDTYTAPSVAIPGWSLTAGSVDLINHYWQAANGAQSIDMNGNSPATLSQFITTSVGGTYNFSFWMAGNPDGAFDKAMNVYWNGTLLGTQTFVQGSNTFGSMGWTQVTFNGLAATSGSTEIRFEGLNTGGQNPWGPYMGAALDDVSVVTATPEPASVALMGTGLVGLVAVARRRRKA